MDHLHLTIAHQARTSFSSKAKVRRAEGIEEEETLFLSHSLLPFKTDYFGKKKALRN